MPTWLLLWALLISFFSPAQAQEAEADASAAFTAAARAFQDEVYDRAARELQAFVENYPKSERVPEAVVLRARALLQLQRAQEAVTWVRTHLGGTAQVQDKYLYLIGEAHLQQTNYPAAAETFRTLIDEHPASPLVLDAGFQEAWSQFGLAKLGKVVELLQNPAGAFQVAARERPEASSTVEGYLLLGLVLLLQEQFAAAEQALAVLAPLNLTPQLQWSRLFLLCQIQLQDHRLAEALKESGDLLSLAARVNQPQLQAAAVELRGTILTRLRQFEEAISSYQDSAAVPPHYRRQALLRIIALGLEHRPEAEVIAAVEKLLEQNPNDPARAQALVTLGELHLRQYTTLAASPNAPASTNTHLKQASARFRELLAMDADPSLQGRAELGLGWCAWEEDQLEEAQKSFQAACTNLPPSEAQAVALFKLAETELRLALVGQAVTNLNRLVSEYKGQPTVQNSLFPHVYYQLVRANLELGELAAATIAMQTLLRDYPESSFRDPGMLLVAQAVSEKGGYGLARSICQEFIERFSKSALLPEVSLASARSYVEEQNWEAAIREYQGWIERFPTNALLPEVQFDLAWAHAQAGQGAQAVELFSKLVDRFPTHPLAARARYWMGDYYFTLKQYVEAQIHYQKLAESFPGSLLAYEARMMAGRAAFASRFWKDAAGTNGHFNLLVRDEQCPPAIRAEAYFALGDTLIEQGQSSTNETRQCFQEAIVAFNKIPSLYPTNRLVPLAWGRVGDCYLQLGRFDPVFYSQATNAYGRALGSPGASPRTRSQAEIGIGRTLEKMAELQPGLERDPLLDAARDHYLNVVYGKTNPAESPDPFWLKEAGLAAARLAESAQQWETASHIYARMAEWLPPLRPSLERRLQKAQERVRQTAN